MKPGQNIVLDDLILMKCLGKGAFGEVYLTSKKGKTELFATKRMNRSYVEKPNNIKYLKNEIAILRELNHKNIVKLEDVKLTKTHYYLVMEYCNGGSLNDCLKKYYQMYGRPFTEEIVQYLMKQILDAVKYIHQRNIIHRDLKLDNILVKFNSKIDKENLDMMKSTVKLIDFGFATHLGNSNKCYTVLGSPANMDPKILEKMEDMKFGLNLEKVVGYDQKADIWSLGTLCYEMLIGKSAFCSKGLDKLVQNVESGTYTIPTNLSKEVVSFLNAMLQYNALKRLSAEQLSKHHFLTKNLNEFEPIDVQKISKKISQNKLKVNIKRNKTIWSIFNEEDEDKLINVPANYLNNTINEETTSQYSSSVNTTYTDTQKTLNLTSNNTNYQNSLNSSENIFLQKELVEAYTDNNQNYTYDLNANNGNNTYDNSNNQYYTKQYQTSPETQNVPFDVLASSPDECPMSLISEKVSPIMQIPTFGVPSPGEDPNSIDDLISHSGVFHKNYEYSNDIKGNDVTYEQFS